MKLELLGRCACVTCWALGSKVKEQKMAFKTEYKVGHMVINLRILLEPKGFLRIIMMVSRCKGGKEVVKELLQHNLCVSAPKHE